MIDVFDEVIELPDLNKKRQFDELIGLDHVKERLIKEGLLLLKPSLLEEWSKKHHSRVLPVVTKFQERPPLIIFSGDVGTGKTTLADSFGDSIARTHHISVRVAKLSLKTRGSGAVGEMTRLVSKAFEEIEKLASQNSGCPSSTAILVIDEADALAQSREFEQMHHEDRAGVNALIRGVDRLTAKRLPVLVVMCTNRASAIDPAVMRRAAVQFHFERPNQEQRAQVLKAAFDGVFNKEEINRLAEATGPKKDKGFGFTYSDLTQKLIPSIVLRAYPDQPVTLSLATSVLETIQPTKPFSEDNVCANGV